MPSQLIVHDDFFSDALGVGRTLVVYLPAGYGRDTRCHYPEAAGAGHNESAWAERFPAVLEWLYSRKKA